MKTTSWRYFRIIALIRMDLVMLSVSVCLRNLPHFNIYSLVNEIYKYQSIGNANKIFRIKDIF